MIRKAWHNAGEYPLAFDRYMALAMKAQSECRATLEALAKLHQPREQTVIHKHVHVAPNGQAIIAEELHYAGGQIAGTADRAQAAAISPALSGPDPLGQPMLVADREGQAAVPNARRSKGQRRTARKPKRAQTRAQVGGDEPPAPVHP